MHVQMFQEYPSRPAEAISRGAELASRFAGIAAFTGTLVGLLYLVAF